MQIFITYDIIWRVSNITGVKGTMINFVDVVLRSGDLVKWLYALAPLL
jgi:hypothetical protein